MIRFAFSFVFFFATALGVIYWSKGVIAAVFSEYTSAFVVLALLVGSMSYALYSYVDNIAKEVSDDGRIENSVKYVTAIETLNALKKEVLVNSAVIAALLLLERAVYGASLVLDSPQVQPFTWPSALALSFRIACFATGIVAAAIQFHGFLIANEYRAVIGKSGNSANKIAAVDRCSASLHSGN